MNLWPHQQRALDELDAAIEAGERRICVTCPTGGGKSLVMYEHMSKQNRAILYTDRKMLMQQIADGLESHGIEFGIRAAGHEPRLLEDKQLAMVQTEASRVLNGGKRDIHAADVVYIDEFHKNAADSMQQLLERHEEVRPDFVMVGVTATPLGVGHLADHLIVAGTNSELRKCGALVLADHKGPDEPDTKWIGKIAVTDGECGIPNRKRQEFCHRVFGRVVEHYDAYNPQRLPGVLFAPDVAGSIYFAKMLTDAGIKSAHIDGENVWIDGELHENDSDLRDEIADRSKSGDIKIVCNRFVLREGIDWPWLYHGIFATVFGSLTSYIQAGGRLLRAYSGLDHVVIQDHGGNWWRHGSLNADREWSLEYTDRIAAGMREDRIRKKEEREPIVCPKCHTVRATGPVCHDCGYQHEARCRLVLQHNGTLREMKGDIFRKRRLLTDDEKIRGEWAARVRAVKRSQKPTVRNMTFAQLEVSFARDHAWMYPPRDLPSMPVRDVDFYRPVREVVELRT